MTHTLERFGAVAAVTTSAVLTLSAARRPTEPRDVRAEARIVELERRIEALEVARAAAAQAPSTVKAPFFVVDDAGRTIFSVDAVIRGWRVVAPSGKVGATGGATDEGGRIAVGGDASRQEVVINTLTSSAGIEIRDARESARVRLDLTAKGQSELSLLDAAHNEIARFGEVAGGSRLEARSLDRHRIAVVDAEGTKATLALQDAPGSDRVSATFDGRPQLAVFGDARKPLVELIQQPDGGGAVSVNDKNGKPSIAAYSTEGGARIRARNASGTQSIMLASLSNGAEMSILQGTDEDAKRASLMVVNNKPELALFSDQTNKIVNLLQGENGGGRLTLGDAAGKVHAIGYAGADAGVFEAMTPSADRIAMLGAQAGLAVVAVKEGPKTSRASLSLTNDGKSSLAIMNKAGNGVVMLSQGSGDAGILQLSAASGGTTVEAGTLPSGLGIVRVGPQFVCTGRGGFAAPDCIKGHP